MPTIAVLEPTPIVSAASASATTSKYAPSGSTRWSGSKCALLAHPQRLKQEYERRLERHDQNEGGGSDIDGLERRKHYLETGKSRLIDSYAEGIIDKTDFEPKMTQLKIKLGQIDEQIGALRQHQAGQFELFLVINRLEEFAAAVTERLETIDFQTKREIICALVKRVEIYKDEVVVVFRVDPDPGFSTDESSTDTHAEIPSMQDRTRRNYPALRPPRIQAQGVR